MYGAAATWRRRWYAHPTRAKELSRPVISVGNLRAGGSGKTPVVAHLARLLQARGERPVILSRGYARTRPSRGVTIVSDSTRVLVDVARAGDEPLMLAQGLPGVPVLVGADRFRSGLHAERELGATVHLLDDGFQHVKLKRDVDLLLADEDDLKDHVLPVGRLREPLANASAADAVLVATTDPGAADRIAKGLGVSQAFRVMRSIQPPRRLGGGAFGDALAQPAFAFAGIAGAERFFRDLRAFGWKLSGQLSFADHHVYSQRDIDRVVASARKAGAQVAVTTEKDAVRLTNLTFGDLPVAVVPLVAAVEPAVHFTEWLMARIVRRQPRSR